MIKKRNAGFFERRRLANMIKEALDNLPSGICYFDDKGIPLLINKTMYQLMFMLTEHDIQDISDFDNILNTPAEISPGDGRVWQFQKNNVGENKQYIEIIASDVTELCEKKHDHENSTIEQQNIMLRLEEISKNVISITRNEEILAMKMHIHNELGYALAETRRFITSEHNSEEKAKYIANHRNVAKKLLGEIGNDDEIDIFSEMKSNAEKLGVKIILEGNLSKFTEGLMTRAVRECLINTIRHGGGDKVFVKTCETAETFTAVITNNGKPPEAEITEGGGLKALRKNIEASGGTMTVESLPEFAMKITLPVQEKGEYI